MNFYPRPLGGGRPNDDIIIIDAERFLSTPSEGRATGADIRMEALPAEFLSTPSEGRATESKRRAKSKVRFLSTPSEGRATASGPSRWGV